jgi:gliding motility-associated-like protein
MNGCAIDSIIPVTAIPTVQAEPFITHPITCYGFSDGALQLDIQQGTAPYTVNWLNGPTGIASNNLVAGYYQVTITDGQGCTQTTGIQLNQPDPVVVHVTGPAFVCENDEAQLIATASGGTSHVNVAWPEFNVEGDTLIHHPTSTRVYTAIATDILGCAASDSHTVMLRLRPQGNISTSVAEGCSPVCANFTVNSTGTSTLAAFSWNFSNGETSSNQQQQICFSQSGLQNASVYLVDEYGCSNTLSAEGIVNVFPLPDARFSYNPNTADIVQPEYQFIQESLLASTFQWTFGDGQTSTLASPLHTFPDTGSFTACLRVTSIHGCVDQVCKKVEIDPFPTIYAPNAFTPNGDGTNEVFMIKVTYATKFFLEIFNRWGELIYEGSDPLEGWDGTYKGNRCQEDVYVWRATISNSEKLNKQMIGRVSLID